MSNENSASYIYRFLSVLRCFTPEQLELSTSEISRKVGLPKTTTHRMLTSLNKVGILNRNVVTGKYTIGPELYIIGSLYLSATDIIKAAEPVIKTVNDLTGETVNMGIFDKGNVTVVMKEESKYAFKFSLHVGSVLPAYASAMGKAFLSELTEEEINEIYPEEQLRQLTPKTIITRTVLKDELQQVKRKGVSFNREGAHVGVEGIGSVIRDASGRVVAAISISVPVFRINDTSREQLAKLMKTSASLISYRLGYSDKDKPVRDIKQLRSWFEQNITGAIASTH